MGRQRLVSVGQGGLEDPCAGRRTRILVRFSQALGVNINVSPCVKNVPVRPINLGLPWWSGG